MSPPRKPEHSTVAPEAGPTEESRKTKALVTSEQTHDKHTEPRPVDGDRLAGARRRAPRSTPPGTQLRLQQPTIIPMSEQEHREAVIAIAELLVWVWEVKHQRRPAA